MRIAEYHPRVTFWLRHGFLPLLGALSLLGYGFASFGLRALSTAGDVGAFLALFAFLFLLYGLAVVHVRRGKTPTWRAILIWAALFRLALIPAGLPSESWRTGLAADLGSEEVSYRSFLLYDNDVWRYLWDGRVLAAGGDPYAATPQELEDLADAGDPDAEALFEGPLFYDIFDNVSYRDYTTIYPPLALRAFAFCHALAPGSVAIWKLLIALADLGTCLLLVALLRHLGRRPEDAVLYAWNPLAVKELAGSGHVDGLLIFFLVLATYLLLRGARAAAVVAYGFAILTKLTPILLLPFFLRRLFHHEGRPRRSGVWELALLVALGFIAYLPFFGSLPKIVRGIGAFAREWVFNPGLWGLWEWLEGIFGNGGRSAADAFTTCLALALVAFMAWRDDGSEQGLILGVFSVLGGYVVLSATMMPWYLLWALPFAAVVRSTAWPTLCGLSMLSYLIYIDRVERPWVSALQLLVFAALLLWDRRRKSFEVSKGIESS